MLLLSPADFFSTSTFSKNSFRNTIRVSNGLDPDQDQPDLGPNCLQKLSADDTKVTTTRKRIKRCNINDTVCIMDERTDKPKVECLNFFKVEVIKKGSHTLGCFL